MTTDDSTLREVDKELAEERQHEVMRRYGPILIGAALLAVLGVGGWQFYSQQKVAKAEQGAIAYQDALFTLEEDPEAGRRKLTDIADGDVAGYAALASFRQASMMAKAGDSVQAYQVYRSIVALEGVSKHVRDLARLRSAYLSLDNAGRQTVIADLGDLPADSSPMGYYGRELIALAALTARDYDGAIAGFDALAGSIATPPVLRDRAGEFAVIARAGKGGANITGEARVEDLLERLDATPALAIPDGVSDEGPDERIEAVPADHEGADNEVGDNPPGTSDSDNIPVDISDAGVPVPAPDTGAEAEPQSPPGDE